MRKATSDIEKQLSRIIEELKAIRKESRNRELGVILYLAGPTFVVSALSVNVILPFHKESPWSFWIILGLAFLPLILYKIYTISRNR